MALPLAVLIELVKGAHDIYVAHKLSQTELEEEIQYRMRNLPPVEDAVFVPVQQPKED